MQHLLQHHKGSVLVFAMVMLTILLAMGLSVIDAVVVDQNVAASSLRGAQAFQAAETGISVARAKIADLGTSITINAAFPTGGVQNYSWDGDEVSGYAARGTFLLRFSDEDKNQLSSNDTLGDIRYVYSLGSYQSINRVIEIGIGS